MQINRDIIVKKKLIYLLFIQDRKKKIHRIYLSLNISISNSKIEFFPSHFFTEYVLCKERQNIETRPKSPLNMIPTRFLFFVVFVR